MTVTAVSICPHLGEQRDPSVTHSQPDAGHRCFAQTPPGTPDLSYQELHCLSAEHVACAYYRETDPVRAGEEPAPSRVRKHRSRRSRNEIPSWLWGLLAVLAAGVIFIYVRDASRTPISAPTVSPAATVTPTPSSTPTLPSGPPAAAQPRFASPTALPGGKVLTLTPNEGNSGWFSSGEARGNHLGDSFLYAGYFGDQVLISAVRFDLTQVVRGAPIDEASIRLTGLMEDRFHPEAGGVWSVQFLAADAVPDFERAVFQELFNAPAAVSLFPSLYPVDLAAGGANILHLDETAREWLSQQIIDGVPFVILRISGPGGGEPSLFAWDSGLGPATVGEAPELILSLGAAPATPPPLPTEAVIVATSTETPANVLTVAADAMTATAVATAIGTYTPWPYRAITPTFTPANLATVQALALQLGLAPVVPHTPTPGNAATASVEALYATAIALTTGTPTPPPGDAVTPVIITPTPIYDDVFVAYARLLTATAEVREHGTPTPWAYNAVIATSTPLYIVVTSTPEPANAATAEMRSAYATAVALVIGTFTPMPPNLVTATPAWGPGGTAQGEAFSSHVCADPQVQIASPLNGTAVDGTVVITGTAINERFQYYRLELASGLDPDSGYGEIAIGRASVEAGTLTSLDTTALANGVYTLRLTVVDGTGNYPPPCQIALVVAH